MEAAATAAASVGRCRGCEARCQADSRFCLPGRAGGRGHLSSHGPEGQYELRPLVLGRQCVPGVGGSCTACEYRTLPRRVDRLVVGVLQWSFRNGVLPPGHNRSRLVDNGGPPATAFQGRDCEDINRDTVHRRGFGCVRDSSSARIFGLPPNTTDAANPACPLSRFAVG